MNTDIRQKLNRSALNLNNTTLRRGLKTKILEPEETSMIGYDTVNTIKAR
jgi:hypothetical protein